METKLKLFTAIVWPNQEAAGIRAEYWAENSEDALALLKAEFGEGVAFTMHNEQDAKKVR